MSSKELKNKGTKTETAEEELKSLNAVRDPMDIDENTPWQEMTIGGEIAMGATSVATLTGQWRSNRPVYIRENCKQCLLCAPFCPDSSIPVTDGKRDEFDYDHCKGCGICYKICPFGAIDFVKEGGKA